VRVGGEGAGAPCGSESEREPRITMKGIGCSRRRREGVRLWLGNPKCAYLYLEWLSGFVLGRLGQAIFRDGPYNAPASENQFTEADTLKCPPRLIPVNHDGHFKVPASVNRFFEAGKSAHHGK